MTTLQLPTVEEIRSRQAFPFSNFQPSPVVLDGMQFPTVEHAYQAAKTLDIGLRREIQGLSKPGAAKRAGRHLAIRPDWEQIQLAVMLDLLEQKFARGTHFASQLIEFPKPLIEWNLHHDTRWGRCICEGCEGRGSNWLGILLTIRKQQLMLTRNSTIIADELRSYFSSRTIPEDN